MYSEYLHKTTEFVYLCCSYTGMCCLFYDIKLGVYYITVYSRRRFYAASAIIILTAIFCDVRTFQLYYMGSDGTKTVFSMCYIFSIIITFLTLALCQIMYVTDQIKCLINQTHRFALDFQGMRMILIRFCSHHFTMRYIIYNFQLNGRNDLTTELM
jgi:hypothetical protein